MVPVRLSLFLLLLATTLAHGQLLFPESYAIVLDTTHRFKGSASPSLELRKQKYTYTEISNTADLSYQFKRHAITVANRFELTKDGDEVVLSGGFVYARYKTFYDNPLVWEHYAQYHWADVRGLQQKFAIGSNIRYKLYKTVKGGLFFGIGPFFEHEEWNYMGVREENLPPDTTTVYTDQFKYNIYLSSLRQITSQLELQNAFYVQNRMSWGFQNPRLAASLGLIWSLTEYIGIGMQFQTIYDFKPIVPIDKFYYNTFGQLEVTF